MNYDYINLLEEELLRIKHLNSLNCYGETRLQNHSLSGIALTNTTLSEHLKSDISGASTRVFYKGAWGMFHLYNAAENDIQLIVQRALENAEFLSGMMGKPSATLAFKGHKTHENIYKGQRDITETHLLEIANHYNDYISKHCPGLDDCKLSISTRWDEKQLAVTTGATLYTLMPETNLNVRMALSGTALENSFIAKKDISFLTNSHEEICKEIYMLYTHLRRKTDAVFVNDDYAHCVLGARMAAKLIHEAIGHQAEADFAHSPHSCFASLKKSTPLSSKINIVDYAHTAFGENCPLPIYIDDEGVTAQDAHIIKAGKICDFMTNRETASLLKLPLTGNAISSDFQHEPLIRMRNTALLPSEDTLDEMLASIKNGYYIIDGCDGGGDINGEFAFHVSIGYRIKNGKICESLKDAVIWGNCKDFLKSISMIGNDFEWHIDDCTKRQKIYLAQGAPTIKALLNIGVL